MLELPKILLTYVLTVPVFFAIDMLWLGVLAKDIYNKQLGSLLADKVNWPAAIIFYLLFIAGIIYFAVLPGVDKDSIGKAALNGALLGGLAYATYDLTNLATLKNWSTSLAFIDIAWGIVLTTVVATAGYAIAVWVR